MVKRERQSIDTRALFVFIGAVPNRAWLAGIIELDDHGFIPTGPAALYSDGDGEKRRRPRRQPGMLETSQPGVFAAGDVRSGSVKRVASAVGEGSMAVLTDAELAAEVARDTGEVLLAVTTRAAPIRRERQRERRERNR
jgi:thioredoxin reductase